MNANLRAMIIVVGCGLAACTTQEAPPDGGGGATAGTSGGGSTGAGGSGGSMYATNDGVMCLPATMALLTDFTYVAGDGGVATDQVAFGDATTTLSGGQFYYPTTGTYPLTSSVTGNNWHMSGNLGDYSGFGLFFTNCTRVDASAWGGISFTISGSVPQGNIVTMGIGTLDNVIAPSWLNAMGVTTADGPGRCIPVSGTNQYNQPTCGDATKTIPVTATPTVQNLRWADFTGGKPQPVKPADIITVYWFFPPPTGAGTATAVPYMADLVIDDLKFIP